MVELGVQYPQYIVPIHGIHHYSGNNVKKNNYENNYYFHLNVRKFREISIFLCKYIIHEMYNVCIIS